MEVKHLRLKTGLLQRMFYISLQSELEDTTYFVLESESPVCRLFS